MSTIFWSNFVKTSEQLWYQGQALSLRFSQLKNAVQNSEASSETIDTFIKGIEEFDSDYEIWKCEVIESLEFSVLGIIQPSKQD